MKHVPNVLSAIRLASCPLFIYVFFAVSPAAAFAVFAVASLLDVADGFIARKFNCISDMGKILDPLADKLLQLSAVVCFTVCKMIPLTVVIIMGCKELLMLIGGALISRKRKVVVFSNTFGKAASFFFSASLCLMFFAKDSFLEPYRAVVNGILYAAVAMSVVSMLQYGFFTLIAPEKNKENTCETEENQV